MVDSAKGGGNGAHSAITAGAMPKELAPDASLLVIQRQCSKCALAGVIQRRQSWVGPTVAGGTKEEMGVCQGKRSSVVFVA